MKLKHLMTTGGPDADAAGIVLAFGIALLLGGAMVFRIEVLELWGVLAAVAVIAWAVTRPVLRTIAGNAARRAALWCGLRPASPALRPREFSYDDEVRLIRPVMWLVRGCAIVILVSWMRQPGEYLSTLIVMVACVKALLPPMLVGPPLRYRRLNGQIRIAVTVGLALDVCATLVARPAALMFRDVAISLVLAAWEFLWWECRERLSEARDRLRAWLLRVPE